METSPKPPNNHVTSPLESGIWECGVEGMTKEGQFTSQDQEIIQWLNTQLTQKLDSPTGHRIGAVCYHLKANGGIRKATQDLQCLLDTQRYPFIIRSDAKGYYAHIRHHKLIALLKDYGFPREVCQITTRLCQRMTVRGGLYSECKQGIPLRCAASPALAAIYLSH